MADDKKDDLKARLGLKKKGAATAVPGPVVEGLPPIEPEKPAGPPKPSAESIDAARKAAEAVAAQSGPAIEEFGVGRPDKTPLPAALPTGAGEVRTEYVQVAAEPSPEAERKRLLILLGAVLAAGLLAFFMGRSCSGSGAKAEAKENITRELKDKQQFFAKKDPTFRRIAALADKLEATNKAVKQLAKDKNPLAIEKPLDEAFGELERFVNDNVYIAPEDVLGTTVYDATLMRHLVDYAVRTRVAFGEIVAAVKESKGLKSLGAAPPTELATRWMVVQVEDRDVPELGKIPVGKGLWVARPGHPEKTETPTPDGKVIEEWNQVDVLPVGGTAPIQVKTSQVVQVDLGQFFQEQAMLQKVLALTRMAKLADDLEPVVRSLDPKPILDLVNAAPATGL